MYNSEVLQEILLEGEELRVLKDPIHKQPRHVGVQGVFALQLGIRNLLNISTSPRHVGVQGVFAP